MAKPPTEAFFLAAARGQRFCLFHRAHGAARGGVLFLHAFAEEMHKSRRMAALQAQALAQAGFDVLQIDLLGCGDSSGDFADATWAAWLDDVSLGWRCLAARSAGPFWLWAHRTGCLLATEFTHRSPGPVLLMLWQPVTAGRSFVNQFLRIKALALGSGQARLDLRALRAALTTGEAVEVGGYALSPALFRALDDAHLRAPAKGSRVCWLEVTHALDAPSAPAALQSMQVWSQAGVEVEYERVVGPPFWQTQEITECRPLIAQTLHAMCR